jgi:hypothetical protein
MNRLQAECFQGDLLSEYIHHHRLPAGRVEVLLQREERFLEWGKRSTPCLPEWVAESSAVQELSGQEMESSSEWEWL